MMKRGDFIKQYTYLSDIIPSFTYEKRKIKKHRNIRLGDIDYIEITFEDDNVVLVAFEEKYKMWVVLKFNENADPNIMDKIREYVRTRL